MLPDFDGLRRPSSAIAGCLSSKSAPCQASQHVKFFFLQYFSEKVLLSSSKSSTFCARSRESAAKTPPSLSTSLQNAALQTAVNPTPTPTLIPEQDDTAGFFDLWLAQPSWSPIILTQRGWQTVVNSSSGKKVPLTLGSIESHYRRAAAILGKRFGKLTNYLMIDVDINSPFHPRNMGLKPIFSAMESIGLCRYLVVRSSDSGGLHIYFPLAQPVSAYGLACAAHAALSAANVRVFGGICELFPNRKAYNAQYNGHRLPLQQGSFILDDDFHCIGNDKAKFLALWKCCAVGQDDALLTELLDEKPLPVPKQISVSSLPPIAWTGKGQSNEVMKQLVNYGDRALGLNTIESLANWMRAVAPQLPGFDAFASAESKNDLTRYDWACRWARSHFKSARLYAAKTSYDHNAMVAAEALERLRVALDQVVIVGKFGVKKLWYALSDISRRLFGVGFGWTLFQKHRKLIMAKVKNPRTLGLSSKNKEGKNLLSSESVEPVNLEVKEGAKKGLAQLLTAESVTAIQDKVLKASCPPLKGKVAHVKTVVELAMGSEVIVKQPGSAVDGVKTRITGKTTQSDGTLLYRLAQVFEGQSLMISGDCLAAIADKSEPSAAGSFIRATAAQLLQVLGQACPFVGPGLWEIRRSEMTPKAWAQLKLVTGI